LFGQEYIKIGRLVGASALDREGISMALIVGDEAPFCPQAMGGLAGG
jgi:hypothetical protein